MAWLAEFCRRLAVLFHRDRLDRDLAEEMESHLELQALENERAGMAAGEAESAARRQFGNTTVWKEASGDTWGWRSIESIGQDLRYAFRVLAKNRGFTAVAILSLAFGIGANTAIFTVVNAALLRTLPVRDPGQLIILHASLDAKVKGMRVQNSNDRTLPGTGRRQFNTFSLDALREFRAKASDTAEIFAFFSPYGVGASDGAASMPADVTTVSGNFFEGLGVPMALGRGLMERDDQPGGHAIVITSSFWERWLNRDAAVLGKELRLNGVPMTIVGVTGPRFRGVSAGGFNGPADVFAPLSTLGEIDPGEFRNASNSMTAPSHWWLQVMGRLKPGVSESLANDRLSSVFAGVLAQSGVPALQEAKNPRIIAARGDRGLNDLRDKIQKPLLILLGVVAVVLLLACVNLASLQLARSASRRREIAVRLSLGAGRGRIIRQLLTESLLLSSCGAVGGFLLALWGAPLVARLLTTGPSFLAVYLDLSPDLEVLGFNLLAVLATTVVFGLAPALRAPSADILPNLKDNQQSAARRRFRSPGRLLIAGQTALSLVLLTGSGLLLRSIGNLYSIDTGYTRDRLLLFRLDLGQLSFKPEQAAPVYESIVQSIAATPGVRSVAVMSHLPIGGWRNSTMLSSASTEWRPLDTLMNTVSPGYFTTVGMPIVEGRAFTPRDSASTQGVVVLNQTAARLLAGGRSPVGQILRRHMGGGIVPVEVIGVARDAKFESLRKPVEPTTFVPFANAYPFTGRSFAVRTTGDPPTMAGAIRRAVAAIHPDVVPTQFKTESQLIDEGLHEERLFASLLTIFGVFALLLAAIGLHGVTAYAAARRRPEIGLRIALGAGSRGVMGLVLRQALAPVAAGVVIGLIASWSATRWIEALLYGVQRLDPVILLAAVSLLLGVAFAAAFVPAWRAAHVDPMSVLRSE